MLNIKSIIQLINQSIRKLQLEGKKKLLVYVDGVVDKILLV